MRKIMNEKLTITTSNPVRARFYEYPRFTYPWHFHSEYEIIYVVAEPFILSIISRTLFSYAALSLP